MYSNQEDFSPSVEDRMPLVQYRGDTETEIEQSIIRLFNIIKPNHCGFISKHDILRAVQLDEKARSTILAHPHLQVLGKPKLYLQAFKEMDADRNHKISIEEFTTFVLVAKETYLMDLHKNPQKPNCNTSELHELLNEVFEIIDANHDGSLSKDELLKAVSHNHAVRSILLDKETFWPLCQPNLVKKIFMAMSTKCLGKVSRDEFISFCMIIGNSSTHQRSLSDNPLPDLDHFSLGSQIDEEEVDGEEDHELEQFLQNLTIANREEAIEIQKKVLSEKGYLEKRLKNKVRNIPEIVENALDKDAVTELKAYTKPPAYVKLAIEPVCILFGRRPNWKSARGLLCRPSFLRDLRSLKVSSLSEKTMERVSRYTLHPEFDPALMESVSYAAANLCFWVHAIYEYFNVSLSLRSLQKKLKRVEEELEIVQKFIKQQEKSDAKDNGTDNEHEFENFSMHFVNQFNQTFREAHEQREMKKVLKEASMSDLSSVMSASSMLKKQPFPLHPIDWQGSPSSFKGFTFSASANNMLINSQDIPRDPPPLPPQYEKSALFPRARTAGRSRGGGGGLPSLSITPVRRPNTAPTGEFAGYQGGRFLSGRPEWIGSPSTFRELTFSSTANRVIVNKQSIPSETPPVPGYKRRPQSSPGHGLDASISQLTVSSRRSLQSSRSEIKPMNKAQAKLSRTLGLYHKTIVHDKAWQGSPSSQLPFTFSRTSNKHFKNKQLWPQYDATRVKGISFTSTKSFKKFHRQQKRREQMERSSIVKVRQKAMQKKNKGPKLGKKYLSETEFVLEDFLGNDGIKHLSSFIQKLFNAWKLNRTRFDSLTSNCRGFDKKKTGLLSSSDLKAALQNSGIDANGEEILLLASVASAKSDKKDRDVFKSNSLKPIEYDGVLSIIFSWVVQQNSKKKFREEVVTL